MYESELEIKVLGKDRFFKQPINLSLHCDLYSASAKVALTRLYGNAACWVQCRCTNANRAGFHLSGLTGTASHPGM